MTRRPAPGRDPVRLFVPGRIEVLGKHTDYAGGRSLLAAVDRGFTVDVTPTDDDRITVVDSARRQTVRIPVPASDHDPDSDHDSDPDPASDPDSDPDRDPDPDWSLYPRTVVARLARDFPGRLRGCRIELSSDLPPAAGLSSSSALVTAIFLALDAAAGLSAADRYRGAIPDRQALAGYLGAVERGSPFPPLDAAGGGGSPGSGAPATPGVGTRGGSEDHVAILCAEPGRLVQYAFEPVRHERTVPLPGGHVFVVAASGVRAAKTGSARDRYNRLSDLASRAVALRAAATRRAAGEAPGEATGEATGEAADSLAGILRVAGLDRALEAILGAADPSERDALERRIRHFAVESDELVPAAADALARGDAAAFGDAVDRSQSLAEELLGNQVPETIYLARTARELGATAASAFGAGFGGAVWALVPATDPDRFAVAWRTRYLAAYPHRAARAAFFTTPAAPAARTL